MQSARKAKALWTKTLLSATEERPVLLSRGSRLERMVNGLMFGMQRDNFHAWTRHICFELSRYHYVKLVTYVLLTRVKSSLAVGSWTKKPFPRQEHTSDADVRPE
jgi:hypothetical protein